MELDPNGYRTLELMSDTPVKLGNLRHATA